MVDTLMPQNVIIIYTSAIHNISNLNTMEIAQIKGNNMCILMNYTYPLQRQFVHQQLEFCRFSQGNFLYHVLSFVKIQWIVQYLVAAFVLASLISARNLEEIFFAEDSLAGTEDT